MRFRRYLGAQYASDLNCHKESDAAGRSRNVAEPIFSIYLLGHRLEHTQAPVIRVTRTCCDAATNERLSQPEEFIECLTHDSVIIQIPELKAHRRNRLEKLLAIFDQELIIPEDHHGLMIDETTVPEEFRFIIRKLLQAYAETGVRQQMQVEDEILNEMAENSRAIANLVERAANAERGEAEARQQQAEAERQKEEERTQKDALAAKLEKAVRTLMAKGMSEADARRALDP
jgi:hypothetical protein